MLHLPLVMTSAPFSSYVSSAKSILPHPPCSESLHFKNSLQSRAAEKQAVSRSAPVLQSDAIESQALMLCNWVYGGWGVSGHSIIFSLSVHTHMHTCTHTHTHVHMPHTLFSLQSHKKYCPLVYPGSILCAFQWLLETPGAGPAVCLVLTWEAGGK